MVMVSQEIIIKSIDNAILKCANSSKKALQRGANVTINTYDDGGYSLEYEGASITFDENNNLKELTIDGVIHKYLGDESYDNFQFQKKELSNSEEFTFKNKVRTNMLSDEFITETHTYDNDYEFTKEYGDKFASFEGVILNKRLNNDLKLKNTSNGTVMNKSAHDHFVELEKTTKADNTDYVVLRIQSLLYDNDNITKEHFRNKHHTSFSAGGNYNDLLEAFGSTNSSNMRRRTTTDERNTGDWKILTTIQKDSGVTGLFLGNPLKETGSRVYEWESELNVAPRTKFVRDLIDEENKIIIQHIEV